MSASSFGTSLHKSKEVDDSSTGLQLSDLEHEGIFARYYFDTYPNLSELNQTGETSVEEKKEMEAKKESSNKQIQEEFFTIRTNYAKCRDPVSNEMQEWLGLGLHSKYDGKKAIAKYGRPNVALIIVLDISGSMDDLIEMSEGEKEQHTKLNVAKHSLLSMLRNLKDKDWLSIVVFDDSADVIHPLTPWKQSNAESLKKTILSIKTRGGTDLSVAFKKASEVARDHIAKASKSTSSNSQSRMEYRIIFLTDMQPNMGETSKTGLFGMADECSKQQIYTTFVGVGQDFGSELTQHISTNLRGGQYMTVRTAKEFEDLMSENFDYSVFPLIFDFKLEIVNTGKSGGGGYMLEEVYGTHERQQSTGTLMTVKTLFPSHVNEDGITKGCMILLKIKPIEKSKSTEECTLTFKCSYENALAGNVKEKKN